MRIVYLEIKRVLSSRISLIAILAGVLFAMLLSYVPVSFAYCYNPEKKDYDTGFEAIETRRILRREIEGKITGDDIKNALIKYQNVLEKYNVDSFYELSGAGDYETESIKPLLHVIEEAYAGENGLAANAASLSAENLPDFYEACVSHLTNNMALEQENHPAAKEAALSLYKKVDMPFSYYFGISANAVEYQGILILLVLFCCTVISAPVFSVEYQTGSDNILRCTKYGRRELAVGKILSSLIISTGFYLVCMAIWFVLNYAFWGAEGMRTSVQLLFTVIGLVRGDVGHLLMLVALCGLVMLISSVCLTLFISTKVQNTMISLTLSFILCLLPVIMGWFLPDGIANIAKAVFPSGGIGMNNGLLYDLIDFRFLNLGSIAIWTPYLIMALAILEIPLWYFLAVRKWKM